MTRYETKKALREQIHATVARIRELKAIRDTSGQAVWRGGNAGLDLEQQKGLATLLCLARARMRNRRHVVVLPRVILLPPGGRKDYGTTCFVKDQATLDQLCDEDILARFPGAALETDPLSGPTREFVRVTWRPGLLRRILASIRGAFRRQRRAPRRPPESAASYEDSVGFFS